MPIFQLDLTGLLNTIVKGGGALTLNGEPSDTAGILAAIADAGLDSADISMMQGEVQDAVNEMQWRLNPLQYVPKGEGLAPTLDIRIPGNHNQSWTIGSKWDRKEPGAR